MNGEDRERVKELLFEASRLPPEQRQAFIEHAAGNSHIANEALELLSTLDDSGFLNAVTGAGMTASLDVGTLPQEAPGTRIGRYKLLQRVGEGGFGTVFMAEQVEPVVRRVALKIIKAGMDTRQVIARFEAERQALAMMDHPNIARVFDAGTTENGRPYFVMELVRGETVTRYCDREKLSIEDRLALFEDICGAVQHAHQKGIIHRDIKPSNILVTIADGRPLPKVIDFGIAKATSGRLTEKTLFTEHRQLIGTPEYMSPEQAEVSGIDIDTRSDVYSLGVLLYELLAGAPPFDGRRLRSAPFGEIQRIIRDEEPPRPSLRLRTLAASSNIEAFPKADESGRASSDASALEIATRRRTEPIALSRSLRGDLDWIVMKCLEKDRGRRYATASALADDIGKYLSHEPVSATPPSAAYKFRKMLQRHRTAALSIAIVVITLLVATGVSIYFAVRTSRALAEQEKLRTLAEKNARETQEVAQFQQSQLGGIDPKLMGKRLQDDLLADAKAGMELAGLSATQIAERQQQLTNLLADINPTNIALKALDENIFVRALEAAEEQFKDQPLVKARLFEAIAATLVDLGLFDRATVPQTEALAIHRRLLGNNDPATLHSVESVGLLLLNRGKYPEAEPYLREVLDAHSRLRLPDDRQSLGYINNLGMLLQMQGKREEAEPYFRDLLQRAQRVLGPDNIDTLQIMNNVGGMLCDAGKWSEAETFFRETLARRRRVFGDDHRDTLQSLNNLALALEKQGHIAEAEVLYREAMNRSRIRRGEDHPETLLYMSNLGFILNTLGRHSEGETLTRDAMERRRRVLGNEHKDTLQSVHNMAVLLQTQGKQDEAEVYCREALEGRRRTLGNGHPTTIESINNMGLLAIGRGKPSESETWYREAVVYSVKLPEKHPTRLEANLGLARSLLKQEKVDEAENILTEINVLTDVGGLPVNLRPMFVESFVELYEIKDRTMPHQGYDQEVEEWRKKLEHDPTTTRAAQPASSAAAS